MAYLEKQIPVVEDMAKTTLFGLPVIGSAAAAAEDAFDVVQGIENTVATGSGYGKRRRTDGCKFATTNSRSVKLVFKIYNLL